MRKHLPILVLAVTVFSVSVSVQPYTFIRQSYDSLFLLTPDYFRDVMVSPFGPVLALTELVAGFYATAFAGAVWTALMVVAVFAMLRGAAARCGVRHSSVVATVAATSVWGAGVLASTPVIYVSAVLIALFLRVLSLFFKSHSLESGTIWTVFLSLTAAATLFVCLSEKVRAEERMAKVEVCARNAEWDKVLDVATPMRCIGDKQFLPYAALALASKGQFYRTYSQWPFDGPEDLDMEGLQTSEAYYFGSLMFEALGCPNEAIHRIFQYSCHRPYGSSVISLYQLIRYNVESGNYSMVRKYASVLSRNPANHFIARQILRKYSDETDTCVEEESATITDNPLFNLGMLRREGLRTSVGMELFQVHSALMDGRQ